jgi:hypothetical protein
MASIHWYASSNVLGGGGGWLQGHGVHLAPIPASSATFLTCARGA